MIQEASFNDIRRNYILASVLLIFFLLYGNKITIEQLLIFKFDIKGNWAIISAYWDLFIIFILFLGYTLARYYIYGIDEIRRNKYNLLLLIDILKTTSSQGGVLYKEIKGLDDKGESQKFDRLTIDNSNSVSKDYTITCGNNFLSYHYNCPQQIKDLQILNDRILFSDIEIIFQSKNIKKDFGPGVLNLIFRKEFSDFLWPLSLLVIIFLILIIKVLYYLYQYISFCI